MSRRHRLAFLLAFLLAAAAGAQDVRLAVTVQAADGTALADAYVRLYEHRAGDDAEPLATVVTDAAGTAVLPPFPAGRYTLLVTHVAHDPHEATVNAREGARPTRVRLRARRLALGEVSIAARRTLDQRLRERVGFEERRRRGPGTFFTADDLARRNVRTLPDALRMVPGLYVSFVRGTEQVFSNRRFGCPVALFLDGTFVSGGSSFLAAIPVETVTAVEAYSGNPEVPINFRPLEPTCGAVLVWTRITETR
ncbi:MAG: TonB-dependent receptor plug domain-containing protein [Rubricoccaceae bacterium]